MLLENHSLNSQQKMEENLKVEANEFEKTGTGKIPSSDQPNGVGFDSFVVDATRLSHITNKELTSKTKLNRSFSRNGSQQRNNETKANKINENNEKESKFVGSASPRATLGGTSMLEKTLMGQSDRPQPHHQITIKTLSGTECRTPIKRPSFRRSQPPRTFDPRKIFFFLATLSSVGTILLIYFTLSISKPSGDDNAQNW